MLLVLIVAAALQSTSAPAVDKPAPATEGAVKVAQAPAAADPAKDFVCRMEMVTGTRFPAKVCRRKAEFDEKAHEEQLRLRQMQRPQYNCQISHPGAC